MWKDRESGGKPSHSKKDEGEPAGSRATGKTVFEWIRNAVRSRYVVMLEEEVARLRAENRALLNSLLGTAGFPPVEIGDGRMAEVQRLRRRSWQQVQRVREEEAGKAVGGL